MPSIIHKDVSASKVFIAASENALCGAHQKGNVFKEHMFDVYVAWSQSASDKPVLEQSSQATQEEYMKKGVCAIYPEHSADSIHNHLKGQIAPEVMK